MLVLAMALGASKSMFCQFDSRTGRHRFGGGVTRSGPRCRLLERLRLDRVVVEICPQAACVQDIAAEMGIPTLVADATQDAWPWRSVKRKTDRDDALKLARLAAIGPINRMHVPELALRQWRRLITAREAAVAEQTRGKVRIRALLHAAPRGKSGWSRAAKGTESRFDVFL